MFLMSLDTKLFPMAESAHRKDITAMFRMDSVHLIAVLAVHIRQDVDPISEGEEMRLQVSKESRGGSGLKVGILKDQQCPPRVSSSLLLLSSYGMQTLQIYSMIAWRGDTRRHTCPMCPWGNAPSAGEWHNRARECGSGLPV